MSKDTTIKNKRFIAAAICPQCNSMDSIYTFNKVNETAQSQWRACAYCDFEERFVQSPAKADDQELKTRVNQHRVGEQPLAHEVPVESIKIID